MLLVLPLLFIAVASAAAFKTDLLAPRLRPWVLPFPAVASFVLLAVAGTRLLAGEEVALRLAWVPQIGLDFALNLNGLGLLLSLLVTGIGALILVYATGYMAGHPQASRLYGFLYAFMLAMVGVALSDHLLLFFVFWELTSLTSYLLIGFQHAGADSRRNALQALLVTGLGGMALLAGVILLSGVTGTWYLSELIPHREAVLAHPHYPAILALVLLGAFTKSAQFPFQFWLPNAMAAPTPVSAYLHSATMVKAGVFLLALMLPVLGGTTPWTFALCTAGGITLLGGGFFGLRHHDLKKILAGTTLSVLGLLTVLLGIGTDKAVLAAMLFLLGHALYKATLFMVAGSIDHETGTRDSRVLGGLRRVMPWTAAAALLAALSKMGLPPFFGFLGKEYTYKAGLATELQTLTTVVLVLGNAMILALAVKAAILPFWRRSCGELPKQPHEAPRSMLVGPLLLAVLGFAIGCFPHLADPLVLAAKSAALGQPATAEIKLWHGFNLPLLLSGVTLLAGFLVVAAHHQIGRALERLHVFGAEDAYNAVFADVLGFARWQTRLLQSGLLRNYLLTIIGATVALVVFKLWRYGGVPAPSRLESFSLPAVIIVALMLGAVLFAVTTASRMTALVALGVVGFGVALIFALFSAPDLAITQILVETLTVVLFAWVVFKLPALKNYSGRWTLFFDATVSVFTGLLVSILVIKSEAVQLGAPISGELAAWSLAKAYGANVVNVILVDFRALDTWGEICVLAIAAIGVWSLLRNLRSEPPGRS